MIKQIFKLDKTPKPDDAADALAIAICCAQYLGFFIRTKFLLPDWITISSIVICFFQSFQLKVFPF